MSDQIQYQPSLGSVFLAIARGEHLAQAEPVLHWPVTCPHCMSEDTKPTDDTCKRFECTNCGEVFDRPLT